MKSGLPDEPVEFLAYHLVPARVSYQHRALVSDQHKVKFRDHLTSPFAFKPLALDEIEPFTEQTILELWPDIITAVDADDFTALEDFILRGVQTILQAKVLTFTKVYQLMQRLLVQLWLIAQLVLVNSSCLTSCS